jgi:hypothetical protein
VHDGFETGIVVRIFALEILDGVLLLGWDGLTAVHIGFLVWIRKPLVKYWCNFTKIAFGHLIA